MALEGAKLPADRFRVSIFTGSSAGEVASIVNGFLSSGSKSLVEFYLTHSSTAPVVMVVYVPLE